MLLRLFLLFAIVPPLELYLLLRLANIAGIGTTILIVISTAIIGSMLARHQGMLAWWRFRDALAHGRMPSNEIADGLMVIFAAALLLTPGLLTDTVGFLLLIPFTRKFIRRGLVSRISNNMSVNSVVFRHGYDPSGESSIDESDTIDASFRPSRQTPENDHRQDRLGND
ncbi:MAG TPA: exlusion protein FxsA [Planctomycetaceae bacterium]|nr:exlusion protein FxsA [Planctomycetaceae bacterium]